MNNIKIIVHRTKDNKIFISGNTEATVYVVDDVTKEKEIKSLKSEEVYTLLVGLAQKMGTNQECYALLCETMSGPKFCEIVGKGDGINDVPGLYITEREALLEYIDILEGDFWQFKSNSREWEDIHFNDFGVYLCNVAADGTIIAFDEKNNPVCEYIKEK